MRTDADRTARSGGAGTTRGRRRGTGTPIEQGTVIAGYRLVRLLGRSPRAEVHLARPVSTGHGPVPGTGETRTENVALKLLPASHRDAAEAEITALHAVRSEHVVQLLDVATLGDGGICLIQTLCARGSAASLVRRRGTLTSGELVTLVSSVLRGLGDLHDAGYSHGALDLTHVLLDGAGRPVLTGLGASLPLDRVTDPLAAGRSAGSPHPVEGDLARLQRMVTALREPGDSASRSSASRWEAWLEHLDELVHDESELTPQDLAEMLLDVTDAAPLADPALLGGSPTDVDSPPATFDLRVAMHVGPAGGVHGPAAGQGETPGTRPSRRRWRALARRDPASPARRHRAPGASRGRRTGDLVGRGRTALTVELAAVRTRVWVLGAATLIAVLVGIAVMPVLGDAAHGASPAGGATDDREPAALPSPSAVVPSGAESEDAAQESPLTSSDGAGASWSDVGSEDPGVAAPALLALRASCLRSGERSCLGDVDQPASAMDDADRTRGGGPAETLSDAALHVDDRLGPAQRLGDTALITLSPPEARRDASGAERRPASLLMVRGEAGWRIRDLMDDR